jgi:hypothetical protein
MNKVNGLKTGKGIPMTKTGAVLRMKKDYPDTSPLNDLLSSGHYTRPGYSTNGGGNKCIFKVNPFLGQHIHIWSI